MMEKSKSVLLVALVFASLYQSYLLVFKTPKFDPVNQVEYVQTALPGTQSMVEDLLYPEQIVLHFGDGKHTVLYPNNTFFNMIFQPLRQRTFDGFRRSNAEAQILDWENIRNRRLGVELRFRNGIPFDVLQRIMLVKGEKPQENPLIVRIWFFAGENRDEVKTYFFTDNPQVIFEASRADLNTKDVERLTGLGVYQPIYKSDDGIVYIPEKPLQTVQLKARYKQVDIGQMQNSLFVDPGNIRNFKEKDGAEIYTDGQRGLQIHKETLWMSYSDPIPPAQSKNDANENLNAAVHFVNQHGGWNGDYMAVRVPASPQVGRQNFVFRQMIDSFPILSSDNFGLIRLILNKGVVSNYERSMVLLDDQWERTETVLPGSKDLQQLLNSYGKKILIQAVIPAYRPVIIDGWVELTPKWAAELKDGSFEFLH